MWFNVWTVPFFGGGGNTNSECSSEGFLRLSWVELHHSSLDGALGTVTLPALSSTLMSASPSVGQKSKRQNKPTGLVHLENKTPCCWKGRSSTRQTSYTVSHSRRSTFAGTSTNTENTKPDARIDAACKLFFFSKKKTTWKKVIKTFCRMQMRSM